MSLTVGDLFAGAGGFAEGFRQAGCRIEWAVDNWEAAAKTFEKTSGFNLKDLGVRPGDVIEYEAAAYDNDPGTPNVSRSEKYWNMRSRPRHDWAYSPTGPGASVSTDPPPRTSTSG